MWNNVLKYIGEGTPSIPYHVCMQQRGAGKEQDSIRQQLFGKVFRQASGENDFGGTHENPCKVEDPDCRLTFVFEG